MKLFEMTLHKIPCQTLTIYNSLYEYVQIRLVILLQKDTFTSFTDVCKSYYDSWYWCSFGLEIHMENTENRSSFEKLAQAQYCTEML